MRTIGWLLGWVLASAAATCGAQPIASSSFGQGAGGWHAQNGAGSFAWISSGGDPGGYVQAVDLGGRGLWFFAAPSPYLGDLSSAYGGAISYDIKSIATSAPISGAYAAVQFLGANGTLLAVTGHLVPGSSWSNFSFALIANGAWRIGSTSGQAATAADMQGVLSNVKSLRIGGDFYQDIETTSLDSVRLLAAPALSDSAPMGQVASVPEPSDAALWAVGLVALAGVMLSKRGASTRTIDSEMPKRPSLPD